MQIISERTLKRIDRAVDNGKIIPFLALATLAIALIAGVAANSSHPPASTASAMRSGGPRKTVTTVGYGDVVPEYDRRPLHRRLRDGLRRSVGVVSSTALVTSSFITYQQRRTGGELERYEELREALERIEQRLDSMDRT